MSEYAENCILKMLVDTLAKAIQSNKFHAEEFFKLWFRQQGSSYFFLFKKNLSITNIQYAELLSLIQDHAIKAVTGEHVGRLMFHSTDDFNSMLTSVMVPMIEGSKEGVPNLQFIAKLYYPLFENAVVINAYHGSCAVFLPHHITLDLLSVCAQSGYIHSCGRSVFIRNVNKANKADFFQAIKLYLDRYLQSDKKLYFIPYAHEDFSEYDQEVKHVKESLRHGLDDVKIHVEKVNMGSYRLAQVLSEMRDYFKDRLDMPDPGDYRKNHPAFNERTLWLICDASIEQKDFTKPGEKKYYICHDQLYFNDNPFHIFDENKPGWIAHTTTPHTLIGAMVNLTRPWTGKEYFVLADPFAGTGTTYFEALKFNNIIINCSDKTPILPLLISDNLKFFSLDSASLKDIIKRYELLIDQVKNLEVKKNNKQKSLFPDSAETKVYHFVKDLLQEFLATEPEEPQAFIFSESIVKKLSDADFFSRLVFYTALRSKLRYQGSFTRRSMEWSTAFEKSARELLEEIKSFRQWRLRSENRVGEHGMYCVFPGKYSHSCAISIQRFSEVRENTSTVAIKDACDISPRSCDLIITDPPYGFNTDDELSNLVELYADVISKLVCALKNNGHLIICLPERSYTGRMLPFCTQRSLVIQQVLTVAEDNSREVFVLGRSFPSPGSLFSPPYYWISERALRRVILHFRIRDKQ
ncbi:MAG: hypothetical protein E3K40_12170 [Candidatus Brocadia sp.]|nr:hypothetical protein [Candidatus Brocadia sp.]